MSEISEILKNINKKTGVLDEEYINQHYVPWAINKALSRTPDGLLVAQELNMRSGMTKFEQYMHYYHRLSKNPRRFGARVDVKEPKYLQMVMDYHGFSKTKAMAAMMVLTEDELHEIERSLDTGGVKR